MEGSSGVTVQWLGHATFLLTAPSGETLLVEPFVHSNPACPPEHRELSRVDAVAITHGHQDHVADVATISEQCSPAAVVAIVEVAAWLRSIGIDDGVVTEMNKGGTVDLGWVQITMVDAKHSTGIADGDGLRYGGEAAGLVFTFADGTRIYHAGDTDVFPGMALIAELYAPDLVLLPIGDRYTMGPRSAARACELLGAPRVIPMHYGTWPILTGTPDELRRECDARGVDVEVVALEPGAVLS